MTKYDQVLQKLIDETKQNKRAWSSVSVEDRPVFLNRFKVSKILRTQISDSVDFVIYKCTFKDYFEEGNEWYDREDIRCAFISNNGTEIESFDERFVSIGRLVDLDRLASQKAFNFDVVDDFLNIA
jgi:hypothetical protein